MGYFSKNFINIEITVEGVATMADHKADSKFDSIDRMLRYSIKNNWNVMLKGRHGVGKTHIINSLMDEYKINCVYFSASTMDPWVDFIGIPHEEDDNGQKYLSLLRPRKFQYDEVEAIFMDEYSRSKLAIRNAVMQLIQFKSINDHQFKNLRFVWTAVNPDDDDQLQYDVEKLDPAQKDRFHIQMDVPYEVNEQYFLNKYGERLANSAIEWWKKLPEKIKLDISPRRLDYALDVFCTLSVEDINNDELKIYMSQVIPTSSNIKDLLTTLQIGSYKDRLVDVLKQSENHIRNFFEDLNNVRGCLPYIMKSQSLIDYTLKFIDMETITSLLTHREYSDKIANYVINHPDIFKDSVSAVMKYSHNSIPRTVLSRLESVYPKIPKELNEIESFNQKNDFQIKLNKNNDEFKKGSFKFEESGF